jgi:hypothetical protein
MDMRKLCWLEAEKRNGKKLEEKLYHETPNYTFNRVYVIRLPVLRLHGGGNKEMKTPKLEVPPNSKFFIIIEGIIYYIFYGTRLNINDIETDKLRLSYIAAWEFQVALDKPNIGNLKYHEYLDCQKAWLDWGKKK